MHFWAFFFVNGLFSGPITKKFWNPPFSINNHIFYIALYFNYLTWLCKMIQMYLFYAYTIFHNHVKLYKYNYFYTYTILHDIKINWGSFTLAPTRFIFYIYTYIECKSQTVYTHNTGSNQKVWACTQVTQTWPECVVLTSVGRFSLFCKNCQFRFSQPFKRTFKVLIIHTIRKDLDNL